MLGVRAGIDESGAGNRLLRNGGRRRDVSSGIRRRCHKKAGGGGWGESQPPSIHTFGVEKGFCLQ